ncbi:MAG: peroxiredoxin family protein [Planctomycetota bacterium]
MRTKILTALSIALSFAPLAAQDDFATLRAQLDAERSAWLAARPRQPEPKEFEAFMLAAGKRIEDFLGRAKGEDRLIARLALAELLMEIDAKDRALAALRGIDRGAHSGLGLATAAEAAQRIGDVELRESFLAAAIAREEALQPRMELATFLATRLVEVEKAEAIFTAAEKSREDDEGKALVRWYRCASMREREDIEEDAWLTALEQLAKQWPNTHYGSIARDRLRAVALKVGDEAIPFEAPTLDGKSVRLADHLGKVVLLEFWGDGTGSSARFLGDLDRELSPRGLTVVGIAMFADSAAAERQVAASKRTWPQIFDGRAWMNEVALRYGVERLPEFLLIDRKGRIAMQNIFVADAEGRAELREAILRALDVP